MTPLNHSAEYMRLIVSQLAEEMRSRELARVAKWKARTSSYGFPSLRSATQE